MCKSWKHVQSCHYVKKIIEKNTPSTYVLMEHHVLCHGKSELKCWRQWDHSSCGHLWIKKEKKKAAKNCWAHYFPLSPRSHHYDTKLTWGSHHLKHPNTITRSPLAHGADVSREKKGLQPGTPEWTVEARWEATRAPLVNIRFIKQEQREFAACLLFIVWLCRTVIH